METLALLNDILYCFRDLFESQNSPCSVVMCIA